MHADPGAAEQSIMKQQGTRARSFVHRHKNAERIFETLRCHSVGILAVPL